MAAAYGVPLGGALFALEVLRGELALRFVLPALVTSLIATGVSWAFLPDAPTYQIPAYPGSASALAWAVLAGPIIGVVSVVYVRAVAWADHHRPRGGWRLAMPVRWRLSCSVRCRSLFRRCWATAATSRSWHSPVRWAPCCCWRWSF